MGAAGIPCPVVRLGTDVGHGAGHGQCVGGDGCRGGGGRRGRDRGCRFTPGRSARGARWAAGDEGGGCLRSCVSGGGGGGSRCRD